MVAGLLTLSVAHPHGLIEERTKVLFLVLIPIGVTRLGDHIIIVILTQQFTLNLIDGAHHQHHGLDGIGIVGNDFLNLVDGIVEIAITHHEIDVVALVVVGGTSHEIFKVDFSFPAKGHRAVGHGLQVEGVGEHMDELTVGLLGLAHATQSSRFLTQSVVIHLGAHVQRLHILVKQLNSLFKAPCVMRQPDQLIAIAQFKFVVAFGIPALGEHRFHFFIVQVTGVVLILLIPIPHVDLTLSIGDDTHVRFQVFGVGQIEQRLFVFLHEIRRGKSQLFVGSSLAFGEFLKVVTGGFEHQIIGVFIAQPQVLLPLLDVAIAKRFARVIAAVVGQQEWMVTRVFHDFLCEEVVIGLVEIIPTSTSKGLAPKCRKHKGNKQKSFTHIHKVLSNCSKLYYIVFDFGTCVAISRQPSAISSVAPRLTADG